MQWKLEYKVGDALISSGMQKLHTDGKVGKAHRNILTSKTCPVCQKTLSLVEVWYSLEQYIGCRKTSFHPYCGLHQAEGNQEPKRLYSFVSQRMC